MNTIIKGKIEQKANQLNFTKNKLKQFGLVSEWKVIDDKLVCPWHKY